jgi:hypothetical protein
MQQFFISQFYGFGEARTVVMAIFEVLSSRSLGGIGEKQE